MSSFTGFNVHKIIARVLRGRGVRHKCLEPFSRVHEGVIGRLPIGSGPGARLAWRLMSASDMMTLACFAPHRLRENVPDDRLVATLCTMSGLHGRLSLGGRRGVRRASVIVGLFVQNLMGHAPLLAMMGQDALPGAVCLCGLMGHKDALSLFLRSPLFFSMVGEAFCFERFNPNLAKTCPLSWWSEAVKVAAIFRAGDDGVAAFLEACMRMQQDDQGNLLRHLPEQLRVVGKLPLHDVPNIPSWVMGKDSAAIWNNLAGPSSLDTLPCEWLSILLSHMASQTWLEKLFMVGVEPDVAFCDVLSAVGFLGDDEGVRAVAHAIDAPLSRVHHGGHELPMESVFGPCFADMGATRPTGLAVLSLFSGNQWTRLPASFADKVRRALLLAFRGGQPSKVIRELGIPEGIARLYSDDTRLVGSDCIKLMELVHQVPATLLSQVPGLRRGDLGFMRLRSLLRFQGAAARKWACRVSVALFSGECDEDTLMDWANATTRASEGMAEHGIDLPGLQQRIAVQGMTIGGLSILALDCVFPFGTASLSRALRDCEAWHARVVELSRRVMSERQATLAAIKLPDSPVPDGFTHDGYVFEHVGTGGELVAEGTAMRHCVATYLDKVLSGASSIFRVSGAWRGTLELVRDASGWSVGECRGKRNCVPPSAALAAAGELARSACGK